MTNYYRVLLGDGNEYAAECFAGDYIGVGAGVQRDLSQMLVQGGRAFHELFATYYLEAHPGVSREKALVAANALWKVCMDFELGDVVLCPDGAAAYRFGVVSGYYEYRQDALLPHRRGVHWRHGTIRRSVMSTPLQQALDAAAPLVPLSMFGEELEKLLAQLGPKMAAKVAPTAAPTAVPTAAPAAAPMADLEVEIEETHGSDDLSLGEPAAETAAGGDDPTPLTSAAPAFAHIPAPMDGPGSSTGVFAAYRPDIEPLPASAIDDHASFDLDDPRNVPVWFGTNRAPVDANDPASGFSNTWSAETSVGRCIVNIPKGHVPGSTGSAWWVRLVQGDDRLTVQSIEAMETEHFWSRLSGALAKPNDEQDGKDALFFLHGFNVAFKDAAIRTAQLAYDLRIQPAIFFSWPSAAEVSRYAADEASIEASHDAVTAFLQRLDGLALQNGATLHVVAHSMGNRTLLRALEAVAAGLNGGKATSIDKLVFAAPDVDARVFMQAIGKIQAIGTRKTLYASACDKAIWLSEALHKYDRAGQLPPVTIAPGLDTIDASGTNDTFLGHGYFASVRALLADLVSLFKIGSPPDKRTGVEEATTADGKVYWRIL